MGWSRVAVVNTGDKYVYMSFSARDEVLDRR